MPLPGRAFYNLFEAAARWGCTPVDIVEWSHLGHLKIVASIPGLKLNGQVHFGLAEIPATDLIPFFRRASGQCLGVSIYRARPEGEDQWVQLDPEATVQLSQIDILITSGEAEKFEAACEIGPRANASGSMKHDWDGMWVHVATRIHESGLPDTNKELAEECEEWFLKRTDGRKCPDLSTIMRRLRPLFRVLREE